MPPADPDMKFVFAKVRDVGEEDGRVVVNALAGEDPTDVGPKAAVLWRMRVAFFVGVLVMHAVDGDEEDGAALKGERAACGEGVLHPLGRFVAAMGEEAVVSHADAESACEPR